MPRGKVDCVNDVYVPVRRAPVRIEDVDNGYGGSRKALRISDLNVEDCEDLATRSRNKDRRLLDDITSKLVHTSFQEPVKVRRSSARRPPVAPHVFRHTVAPVRRAGIRPVPSMSPRYRASSLPPVYVTDDVVTQYNFYEPPPVRAQPLDTYYRACSEPPKGMSRSSELALKNAKRSLGRIERELGLDSYDYDYATPVAPVRMAREPVVRARTANRTGAMGRRSGSLPPPRNRVPASDIEREVEEYLERPVFSQSLRHRASSLERSRPRQARPSSPPTTVLSVRSRPHSVERMPSLDPYRPNQGSVTSYSNVTPYQPARVSRSRPVGLPPKAPANFRPEMSDTRRRIREVLCHTKRDPNYYD